MNPRVAFMALAPDAGHVLPLLRLAASFAGQGYEVKCFFPDECAPLAEEFGLPMNFFGRVTQLANKAILHELSRRSIFYNGFSFYADVLIHYLDPISLTGAAQMEYIREQIKGYDPDLLMVDNHLLKDYFIYLAESLAIPIVFHESGGNYRYSSVYDQIDRKLQFHYQGKRYRFRDKQFLYIYGFINVPLPIQALVVYFGRRLSSRVWRRTHRQTEKIEAYLTANLKRTFPGLRARAHPNSSQPLVISTGLPYIEREITQECFTGGTNFNLFPPAYKQGRTEIDPGLRQWIESAGSKPIVYICLGTMVYGNQRFIREILAGLTGLNVFILWSAPADQVPMIKELNELPDLRVEEYVPQPKILALQNVRCFITHAGAGGVQDGLMNGKPMLCIPFMFEQAFNSSVVELLQAGIKLWKRRVNAKSIGNSVSKLLNNPQYRKAAEAIMIRLQSKDSGKEVIRFLKDQGVIKDLE